jgi:N-methylhydantoinase A/oxoprolinase/acetone carboxylase beta subunit
VLAIDAGGTMTDTFVVDERGAFVVGKAQTTPEDESVGFMESSRDALGQWDSTPEDSFPRVVSGIYSGTAMLNRLLARQGRRIGAIVNSGQEDYLRIERGIQTYLGYSYADRLHVATHFHNPPLVPRELMKGVRGRIDVLGQEVLPLREEDVREAARGLLEADVEGIVVSLLFSYRNAEHELRVGEILAEEMDGKQVPVYLSCELYPIRRDLPRLNSTLIEAYAAEPSRGTLQRVREATKQRGAGFELRVMAAHGGTISIEARELARTLVSGPIGGVVGGQALAREMGLPNVLCTDIGGTSFDIALLTDGRFEITPTPDIARFVLNIPLVRIDSIGAGTGSFVRINPNSNRPELGPDSAGYTAGVSYRDVLVPAWAAGFSAFGCACADFEYRYDQTIDMPIQPDFGDDEKAGVGMMITGAWLGLQERVAEEFGKSGVGQDEIQFTHAVRMQYYGQLNDIEIVSPRLELEEGGHVDELIAEFEDAYAKVYARSARSPELGYLVTQAIVLGKVPVEKPALPELPDASRQSPGPKGSRPVWWDEGFEDTPIYELEGVGAGQSVVGPAVLESPATTFAIPPERRAALDRHQIFHLERE